MDHHSIYYFCPVDPGCIRIVTIAPGSKEDPIVCTLRQEPFPPFELTEDDQSQDQYPSYKALSYVWGTDREAQQIECNGNFLRITRNLYAALLHIRQERQHEDFWIDAICINQEDVEEKNHQLPRMRQIYAHASETILWLGTSSFFSKRALRSVASETWPDRRQYYSPTQPRWKLPWLWRGVDGAFESIDFICMILLLRREYFTRIWVVQEIVLSPNPIFMAGDDRALFNNLASIADRITRSLLADENAWHLSNVYRLRSTSAQYIGYPGRDLLALASLLRGSHSSDPRDKIFGLLGLCGPAEDFESYGVEADYNLNTADTYCRLAMTVLTRQRTLRLFGMTQYQNTATSRDLPSWVPDWSYTDSIPIPISDHANAEFSAAGVTFHMAILFDESEIILPINILVVSGHPVDDIVELGCECNSERARRTWLFYLFFLLTYPDSHKMRVMCQWEQRFRQLDDDFPQDFAAVVTASNYTNDNTSRGLVFAAINRWQNRTYLDTPLGFRLYHVLLLYILCRVLFNILMSLDDYRIVWVTGIGAFSLCVLLTFVFVFVIPYGGWEDPVLSRCGRMEQRRMARTNMGRLALVPASTLPGDEVILCEGGTVPLVMRRCEDGFRLIGESYVHGIMYGEAFMASQCTAIYVI